ncbi:CoA transferase [[Enterobacter] lignolyticus]|uniref:L-carnitine dehydratase/bile acid-inducible protein F n=1 Tax=Enterobacter lignolyticus (strain SCF1) TaxID=701347 RepID=E3G2Q0_ENTLS|nr:CoA transferase [[Enterobacter] lignolyticus]ADO48081.1 L-carnitine dehydratase/bile acid-inducible protein F [[Enterobacter] lignolyticus SCF1]
MREYAQSTRCYSTLWQAFDSSPPPDVRFLSSGALPSCYAVSDFAAASMAVVGAWLARVCQTRAVPGIDRRLASFWFQGSVTPLNRSAPVLWDPLTGDYQTADGWIRLHTNAAHHRQAMASVLGKHADKAALAPAVRQWRADALEQAIVDAGGCAAAMRSAMQWQQHPQGSSVIQEPLLHEQYTAPGQPASRPLAPARPLLGVRILDLTRIIAGPVATRMLAGLGADVLRIDPPDWAEPALEEEITPGKRCARLNFRQEIDRQALCEIIRKADVIVHGYRADALEALGLDAAARQRLSPGIIDVSLNAWGWSGPWRNRRGFDSLVQMACGIAAAGQQWRQSERPFPLPVQALDHATGYLMAAAVLKGLHVRQTTGQGYQARFSLARTAHELMRWPAAGQHEFAPRNKRDERPALEWSAFGLAQRLRFPLRLPGTPVLWSRPPVPLGTDEPRWLTA